MKDLFGHQNSGAKFSDCGKHRLFLWRIWDESKPMIMFIGLNPSTANATEPDPTITRVISIANNLGYGGIFMMNLFTYISTDPDKLNIEAGNVQYADWYLETIGNCADTVVFAWGAFKVMGRDKQVMAMFPDGHALHINNSGTPKHPLYCRSNSKLIKFEPLSKQVELN